MNSRLKSILDTPGVKNPAFWILFSLSLLVRLALIFGLHNYVDARTYENGEIADNLINGFGYSGAFFYCSKQLTAYMPPVYPIILVAYKSIVGNNYIFLQMAQAVMGALSCGLIFVIWKKIGNGAAGFIAGLLCSMNPIHAASVTAMNEQALHSLLVLIVIFLSFDLSVEIRTGRTILLAITAALLVHLKPVAFPFLIITWSWIYWKSDEGRTAIRAFVLYGLILAGLIAPWTARNYRVFDKLFLVSNNFEVNYWQGNNPNSCGSQYTCDGKAVDLTLDDNIKSEIASLNEMERNELLDKIANDFISGKPLTWLKYRAKSFLWFWLGHAYWISSYPSSYPRVVRNGLKFLNVALFITFIAGLFFIDRAGWSYYILPFALIGSYCGIYTLTHADIYERYRLPLDPIILIPPAYLLLELVKRFSIGMNTNSEGDNKNED